MSYSQGTTSLLYGMSDQSSAANLYSEKVNIAVLLGPAVFFSHMEIKVLRDLADNLFIFKFLYEYNYLEVASSDSWVIEGCQRQGSSLNGNF